MKGRTAPVFLLIFLLTAGGVTCLAHAREIHGIVTDPSGAVVVGAVVQLWAGNQAIATTKTDGKGSYVVQFEPEQIPAGQVRLRVTAEGFAAAERKIELERGAPLVTLVRLEIAALSEQIHVQAKSQPFHDQLDMSEVRESPARDVGEALTEVDGVYKIRRGGIANDVLVRGFQQNNLNVLIDDARVYPACPDRMDPSVYHADFAEVERVEVSKGPFDMTSQGSLGAAIRVVTKTPPLGWRITPSISFGSFGYYNPSLTASLGNDAFRVLAGYSYRLSDPYKDGSGRSFLDYANYNTAARNVPAFDVNTGWLEMEFMPTENQKLSLAYTRQQSGPTLFPYLMMDTGYDNADRASLKYEITNLAGAVRAIRAQSYFTQVIHFMSDHYRTSAAMAMGAPWMMAADARSRAIGGHLEAEAGRDLTVGFEGYYRNWNMMGYMDIGMPPVWVEPTVPNVGTNAPKPQAGVLDTNLPEMPPLRTSAALRYTHKFGFAQLGATGVARQRLVDTDLKETPTGGYGLMNVKLGVSYSKLSARFVVDNLFNRYYYEHLSYFRDPFASGVKIPEPGRNFFGQVKISF